MTNEKKIIIDFIDYYEHPQKLIEILDGIGDFLSLTKTKYGIEIISFCPDLTQNENYLNSIIQKSNIRDQKIEIITEFNNTVEFLKKISEANISINMRYHGAVLSMIYGIPSINIVYDIHPHYPNKMNYLSKLFNMEKFFINFSEINRDKTKNLLVELIKQKNINIKMKTISQNIRLGTKREYSKIFK